MQQQSYKVIPIYEEEPQCSTLLIHCIDYRVQQGVEQFCAQYLHISGQYNRLAVPGGILQFQLNRQWLISVIAMYQRLHEVKRIVIIDHMQCSACRDFMKQSGLLSTNESIDECEHSQHVQYMSQAKQAIAKELAGLEIDMFLYDQKGLITRVDGRSLFELISLTQHHDL